MQTQTFQCAIISTRRETADAFTAELASSSMVGAIEWLRDYPDEATLSRMLRLNAYDLVVVDCGNLEQAIPLIERMRSRHHGAEILAVCPEDAPTLGALMRAGVRDYITETASRAEMRGALSRALQRLEERPARQNAGGNIISFFPCKPGSGTSTTAMNVALTASRLPNQRVLLCDFDRDWPVQAFLNRIRPEHYLQEALACASQIDAEIWGRLRTQQGDLDILPADADGGQCKEPDQVKNLLNFLRRVYDVTMIDLPGSLDAASMEVISESKRVYLVCTQELASIHIALRKAERLRQAGLERELRLVLSRYDGNHVMTEARIGEIVGLPVEAVIPNSYVLANSAIESGRQVDPLTPLGKSYRTLAERAVDQKLDLPSNKRRFLEFLYQPFMKLNSERA